ncbi:glyoxalase/bleomycin resistance/extradiol dioxygenase family protein, partial [Clostridioides difficile]|nr:glyoxalase/bleomycin resistance/extradiol dioxygenase family protein [Clostridioides difficile]
MAFQSKNIFINLPVKDLNKSISFFKELGFEFNQQFSDETTASMIINENIFVLIMVEERFKGFSKKEVTDTTTSAEA